jgi:hypothetical protein
MAAAPDVTLVRGDAGGERLLDRVKQSKLTVAVFFASHCPIQRMHDERLRTLAATYGPRGVTFIGVISEIDASLATESEAARSRDLPFAVVLGDRGASLADALGVEYSTHAVLFDRDGRVLYSGALDSDRAHITASAKPYLRDALEAALTGAPVPIARTEALGCPLQKH